MAKLPVFQSFLFCVTVTFSMFCWYSNCIDLSVIGRITSGIDSCSGSLGSICYCNGGGLGSGCKGVIISRATSVYANYSSVVSISSSLLTLSDYVSLSCRV